MTPPTGRGSRGTSDAGAGIHPIERESFRILAERVALDDYGPLARHVVARVVHATADVEFATTMVVDDRAVDAGVRAMAAGAPVVCDVEMVRAGLPGLDARCYLGDIGYVGDIGPDDERLVDVDVDAASPGAAGSGTAGSSTSRSATAGSRRARSVPAGSSTIGRVGAPGRDWAPTRSARAMEVAAERHPNGAIVVVGCAPSALDRALDLVESGSFSPALVIGLPVGFVGAAEAKQRLRALASATGVPAISNIGEKGGSAAACGACNAIRRLVAGRRG